jgi:hypothetical protein
MLAADVALTTAAVSATSQYQQGKYMEEMGEYKAGLAKQEAESVKEASEFEERETRIEGRRIRARQLLQFAKGGVVPTTGTPLLVGEETTADIEKDIKLQKYGYGLQYSRTLSRGRLARQEGKYAKRAGAWSGGTSLLTGAYRAASIYA